MELSPTKDHLDDITKNREGRISKQAAERKQDRIRAEFREKADQCEGLVDKMQRLVPSGRENGRESRWFAIRDDRETRTQLQARVRYSHQPRNHRDVEMQIDESTTYVLEMRFQEAGKRSKDSTEPFMLAQVIEFENHTSLAIFGELGLKPSRGTVSMPGNEISKGHIPTQLLIDQAQEIEREIVDKMLAAE